MTAQSQILSGRAWQPGHDQTWRLSEMKFTDAARMLLPGRFTVTAKPKDLREFYAPAPDCLGLEPDARILDTETGRMMYVEVKRQGKDGNAEERAYKVYTMRFHRLLAEFTGLDYHPYATIFCDELAQRRRYTKKIRAHIDEDYFLLWKDYKASLLAEFLDSLRDRFLDPDQTCQDRSVEIAGTLARQASTATRQPAQAALF